MINLIKKILGMGKKKTKKRSGGYDAVKQLKEMAKLRGKLILM